MPRCITCNRKFSSVESLFQHTIAKGHVPDTKEIIDKERDKEITEKERKIIEEEIIKKEIIDKEKYKEIIGKERKIIEEERLKKEIIDKEKSERDLKIYKEKFKNETSQILGVEPMKITYIPIHEEPQEKKKSNLACKALRNLHK